MKPLTMLLTTAALAAGPACAHGLTSPTNPAAPAPFDVLAARITPEDGLLAFHMQVAGQAGAKIPDATGQLAGAQVFSYVWPTTLDPAVVGFQAGSGILAPCRHQPSGF